MWFFNAPEVVYGEDALSYLDDLPGRRAVIVTDARLHELGFSARIQHHLERAGIESTVFAEVEPEPSLQTVQRGAQVLSELAPDWIIGLGGGSALDAAKAMWALYERPDIAPDLISPTFRLGLRKARLIAIPTTSGTGSEATWMVVLTDTAQQRKLGLGNRELMPTIAIVDPALTLHLPASITADTGIDALTHAVEGYTNNWRNDFCDGLCLKAAQLVFAYLPRAVANGADDPEAREHMANAATIAGLGFGNSFAGLAHAMGHSFGAYFKTPHGRAVGLFLPYAIEFTANQGAGRYRDLAHSVGLPAVDEQRAAAALADAIRALAQQVGLPTTIAGLGITSAAFAEALPTLVAYAEEDNSILAAPRMADADEFRRLFEYAYAGTRIDF
ncbi:MAG: iron-containing alcohol dehydrogenase [Caldilineaceae bacterium]|nr:iron-containing alcohol dehydrogenase [Caldilineaceae bacterium]